LIEVVVSLAILSVGLVGAMRVFPLGLRASQRSELNSRAAMLAQRTIESLKLQPWEDLQLGESAQHVEDFEVVTRIETLPVEGVVESERLKTVVVTVRWEQAGRTRHLDVVTYLHRETL